MNILYLVILINMTLMYIFNFFEKYAPNFAQSNEPP